MTARPAPLSALDLGEATVAFVPDGEIRVDPRMAYPCGHEPIHADGLDVTDEDGMLLLSVGGILITSGEHRTLIDVGIGDRTIPLPGRSREHRDAHMRGGDLLHNLACLGLGPDDIDTVLITHLHADHVGWLTRERDGRPTFSRASYWVSDPEWDFWNQPANADKPTGPRGQELQAIADARHTLTNGASPAPGITALATPGHTPGHFSFHISGTARRAFVIGDAAHCPAEVPRPDLSWAGDLDPAAAIQIRRRLARLLPTPDSVLVGPHFPDPVFRQLGPIGSTLRPIAGVSVTSRAEAHASGASLAPVEDEVALGEQPRLVLIERSDLAPGEGVARDGQPSILAMVASLLRAPEAGVRWSRRSSYAGVTSTPSAPRRG